MTKRQKRVQKILELRERHLDQSANQLTRARQLAEQAERALEEQQRRTQEAIKEREEMAQRPVTAHEWIDSESWRMRLGNQERVLSEKAARAQVVVQKAHEEKVDWKNVRGGLAKKLLKSELAAAQAAFDSPDVYNLPEGNTMWRVSNAISWIAGSTEDADRKLELQRLAGELVDGRKDAVEKEAA
jgi:flagellar biosynthesis chaperone FliJ